MSGTSHPGVAATLSHFSTSLHFYGISSGLGAPFRQWVEAAGGRPGLQDTFQGWFTTSGARTAGTHTGTASTPTSFPGAATTDLDKIAYESYDWFEHVHILPRAKIEFGQIITLIQNTFEIYSAFRHDSVTLASITNNAQPGVDLPDFAPPEVVGPQSSRLDSTSTDNSNFTSLGTLVKPVVEATADGLPQFDTNILFNFSAPANDVQLLVSGSRIVLIPMIYEAPLDETLAWLTDIIESLDGNEQRIALRKNPRQMFEVTYLLDANDRQRMQAILFDWMDNVFGFPLWHERVTLTAAVSAGATTYQVRNADDCDFRVGGLAVVIQDNAIFDVINISAVTATQITAADPSVNGYAKGASIMPLRTAQIVRAVPGTRYLNRLEEFRITFEVTDNDTGVLTGSTTPGWWSIYNSRVLFDDPNVQFAETMPEEFKRNVYKIDNATGKVTLNSIWDRNKRSHQKGFVLRSREDILTFRRLLTSLRGRQVAFYIPTFNDDDFTLASSLGSGLTTMDIVSQQYVRFAQNRLPMAIFRITFTDGTSLVRTVQSSATVSSTVERLTLDTTWPANRTVDEVESIQFYELVRFDSDEIKLQYPRIGLATCQVPVVRVFDDN